MLMSAIELRTEIDDLLDKVQDQDESFLKVVHSMLSTYVKEQKDPILGYETDGTPVTTSAFLAQADEAMAAVERGEYTTFAQLEKESEEWLKLTK
jgi:hypothetical protein